MYEERRAALDEFVRCMTPVADQVGAIFAMNGVVVGLEAFDSPQAWHNSVPKLARSYGLDLLDETRVGVSSHLPRTAGLHRRSCRRGYQSIRGIGYGDRHQIRRDWHRWRCAPRGQQVGACRRVSGQSLRSQHKSASGLSVTYFLFPSPTKVGNRIFSLNRLSSSIVQYHSPISTRGRNEYRIGLPTHGFV